jgi:MoxR-like ATPase
MSGVAKMDITRVKVKDIKKTNKGFVLITDEGRLFTSNGQFLEDFKDGVKEFNVKVVEKEGKRGKFRIAVYVSSEKPQQTRDEAIERVRKVEKEINSRILFSPATIRLALITATLGKNMMLVGDVGIGKSAIAELVCSAFSQNYGYWQLSRFTVPEQVFGSVDLKKFLEENQLVYNTQDFTNKDFLIFDEFLYADGKVRSLLNDVLVARRLSIDVRGQQPVKARAIYTTGNYIPDLTSEEVKMQGDVAIMDRMHFITFGELTSSMTEELVKLRFKDKKVGERRFEKPIANVADLDEVRKRARNLLTSSLIETFGRLTRFVSELQNNVLQKEYRVSNRKLGDVLEGVLVNAVISGRDIVLPRDFALVLTNIHPRNDKNLKGELMNAISPRFEEIYELHCEVEKAKKQGKSPEEFVKELIKEKGLENLEQVEGLVATVFDGAIEGNVNNGYLNYFREKVNTEEVRNFIIQGIDRLKNSELARKEIKSVELDKEEVMSQFKLK